MTEQIDWRRAYIAGLVDNHAGVVVTIAKRAETIIGFGVQTDCRIKLTAQERVDALTAVS